MGTTYTGLRVQDSYNAIIKIGDNGNLSGTAKLLSDALGNDSPLYLSTSKLGIGVSPSFQFQTSSNAKIGGNLTVAGNLTVNGTTTFVDSTIVEIGDNMIELAKDNTANTMDIGWYGTINSGGEKYVGMKYDAGSGVTTPEFHVGLGTVEPGSTAEWTVKGKLVIGAIDSTGGTFSGQITIPETPTADGHAASKKYVDDHQSVEVAERVEITVKNVSGGSLAKGTIVHVSPSETPPSGNVIEVVKADYDDATKMPGIGVLNETIGIENEGAAVMIGAVSGIDTSSFSAGDELYVGNDGAFRNTKPTATNQLVQKIAVVIKVHASNGSIKVFGAGRSNDVPNLVDRDITFSEDVIIAQDDSTDKLKFTRSGHDTYSLSLTDSQGLTINNVTDSRKELQFLGNGNVEFAGNLYIPEYIFHNGDGDTYIRFLDDRLDIRAGNLSFIDLREGTTDIGYFNVSNNDIDFQFRGTTKNNLIRTDAANDRVGIGNTPSYSFDVHLGDSNTMRIKSTDITSQILLEDIDTIAYVGVESDKLYMSFTGGTPGQGFYIDSSGNAFNAANLTLTDGSLLITQSVGTETFKVTTPYDRVGKFVSTDSGAFLAIQDNNSTDNGIGINVTGDVLKLITADTTGFTLDASQNATFVGDVKALRFEMNPDFAASNEYLIISKMQNQDGGIVMKSKPSGGSSQNDWQIVNHSSTGDLRFYAYGLAGFALTLDRENGNATFGGSVSMNDLKIFDSNGSSTNRLKASYNGTSGVALFGADSNGGNTELQIGTSNSGTYTTALTINSSQNATFAGDIYGNLIELQGIGFKGGEGDLLDSSTFGKSGIGNTFRWIEQNSSSSGSTWRKVCDVTLNTTFFDGVQMEVVVWQPDTNWGNTASLIKNYYSVAFRGSQSDVGPFFEDAIVYGINADLLRVYKVSSNNYELQARSDDDNRDLVVEYTITSKNNSKVTPNDSYTAATTTGGTAYTATANSNTKTKFAGELEFQGTTIGDDLRVNGILYLGAGADSNNGGYFTNKGASNEGISMKVEDGDGFDIYQVWGNAGEASLSFEAVDEAIKLYYAGGLKLQTLSTGIDVTGDITIDAGKKLRYSNNAFMTPENNVSGAEVSTPGTFIVKTGTTPTLGLTIDASQNALFVGEVYIPNKLIHVGDTDTWIQFETNVISFRTGGTDRLTLTNSAATFSTTLSSDRQTITSSSDNILTLDQTGGGWNYIEFESDGTRNFYVGQDSSENFVIGSDNGLDFYFTTFTDIRFGASDLLNTGNILPNVDSTYNLGSTSLRWANVWADNINGGSVVNGSGAAERIAIWSDADTLSYNDNLKWNGEKVIIESGNSSSSNQTLQLKHTRNDADTATNALFIDANFSGTKTAATDTVQSGIFIDLDSSADGSSSDEVRSYGVWSDVRFTGFNDIVRGGYFTVESNNTTEKTSEMVGVYGLATHDSSSTNGGVSNMYGSRGVIQIQDYGDVDNAYGVHGLVLIANNRNANVDSTRALYGEIQIDEATELSYGTMIGCQLVIDNNEGTVPNFGSQYLLKGDYQGTQASGSYGIYMEGSRHYLSNSVGIGTSTPQKTLHIEGETGASASQLLVCGPSDTVGHTAGILLRAEGGEGDSSLRAKGGIFFEREAANGLGKLHLCNNNSNNNDSADLSDAALTITQDKKIGIGTTSPAAALEIYGTGNTLRLDSAANQSKTILLRNVGSGTAEIKTDGDLKMNAEDSGKTIQFFTEDTERMRITSGGNVGIGTSSPGQKLDVDGNVVIRGGGSYLANSGVGELKLGYAFASGGGTAGSATRLAIQPYAHTGGPFIFVARDTSSSAFLDIGYNAAHLTLKHNGYLGMGTQSPNETLQVVGTVQIGLDGAVTDGGKLKIRHDGDSFISMVRSGIHTWRHQIQSNGNYNIRDVDGSANVLTVTDDYRVGVMTDTPDARFQVVHSGVAQLIIGYNGNSQNFFDADTQYFRSGGGTARMTLHNGNDRVLELKQSNASYEAFYEAKSENNGYARFGISNNANAYAFFNTTVGSYRWFHSAGGSLMKLDSNGRLGIGTTSASETLQVNGNFRVQGVGNAIHFDTTGADSSNTIKTINDYETVIANNRGAAGFAVVGNSSIRLGFGANFTASQTNLYIQASNDYVGINRQPQAPLHVAGYIMADTDNSARDAHVERNITIPYQGASGYYDFDPVALFGASAAGGYVLVEVHGWQTRFNAGYIHWRNNGSSNTAKIGTGGVTFRQTAWSGSASGAGISVSTISSSTNVIRITLSGWHSNAHGWQAYIRYPR